MTTIPSQPGGEALESQLHQVAMLQYSQPFSDKDQVLFLVSEAYHDYKTLAKPSNPSVSFLFCEFQLVFHDEFSRNQT